MKNETVIQKNYLLIFGCLDPMIQMYGFKKFRQIHGIFTLFVQKYIDIKYLIIVRRVIVSIIARYLCKLRNSHKYILHYHYQRTLQGHFHHLLYQLLHRLQSTW